MRALGGSVFRRSLPVPVAAGVCRTGREYGCTGGADATRFVSTGVMPFAAAGGRRAAIAAPAPSVASATVDHIAARRQRAGGRMERVGISARTGRERVAPRGTALPFASRASTSSLLRRAPSRDGHPATGGDLARVLAKRARAGVA